jgi:glycerol-3-phosphate dehydrogenase
VSEEAALRASVEWAVAEEECRTLRDFLGRRSPLAWTADGGRSAVPVVLDTMTALLGWDSDRRAREVKAHEASLALTQAFRVL